MHKTAISLVKTRTVQEQSQYIFFWGDMEKGGEEERGEGGCLFICAKKQGNRPSTSSILPV